MKKPIEITIGVGFGLAMAIFFAPEALQYCSMPQLGGAARRAARLDQVTELRKTEGLTAASSFLEQGEGLRLTDEIERITDDIEGGERNLWRSLTAAGEASPRRSNSILLVGSLLALVAAGMIVYHVIAQRKRAEEELLFKTTLLEAQSETTLDGILVVDRAAGMLLANQRFQEMWKVPTDTLRSRDTGALLEHVLPQLKNPDAFLDRLNYLHAHPTEKSQEEVELGDGRIFNRYSSPLLGEGGKYYGRIWYYSDITERKRAEEKIRASEEKFRKAFMTGVDTFYLTTLKDGRIIEVNDCFQAVFGYTREEVIGKTAIELGLYVNPTDREEMVAQIRSQGYVRNLELRGRRKGGEQFTAALSANLLEGSQEPLILGVVRDVTEQKRAEEALVRLRQAVDASGEVVFMTDTEGLFTFINPEFTRLYGYTTAEVVGKVTPRILKSGSQPSEKFADFWETLRAGRVARGQMVNEAKDGRLLTIQGSVSPILDETGIIMGFLAIQRDVTEHQRLEEQFVQAQKMEAVGRLAAGVAHDFNNLLTIIIGHSSLMLKQLPSDNLAVGSIAEIKNAAERASGLTRQLLAFSRQQVRTASILDLNTLVANSVKMLRRLIGEDIELIFNPVPDLGMVCADLGQIEQILMNLAVNARDAMPKGGKLTVECCNFRADQPYATWHYPMPPGAYVRLAVTDTGCGMDAETQERIFEPFFTTKGAGKGTGLGLATVYGIIKQNGGYIWVYSEVGKGTTFKIYFPMIEGAPESNDVRAAMSGGSATVLLVEDESKLRSLARWVLETEGYQVLEAPGCMEALLIASQHKGPIHMLLTDVVMPAMSGRELAERLLRPRPLLKILYMSGYTDDTVVRHGVLKSGVAFLQKPFAPEALARKVREVLDA